LNLFTQFSKCKQRNSKKNWVTKFAQAKHNISFPQPTNKEIKFKENKNEKFNPHSSTTLHFKPKQDFYPRKKPKKKNLKKT
jgi:hypothetical protein